MSVIMYVLSSLLQAAFAPATQQHEFAVSHMQKGDVGRKECVGKTEIVCDSTREQTEKAGLCVGGAGEVDHHGPTRTRRACT